MGYPLKSAGAISDNLRRHSIMLSIIALTALGVVVRAPPPCMMALPSWVPAERTGEIQEPAAQAAFMGDIFALLLGKWAEFILTFSAVLPGASRWDATTAARSISLRHSSRHGCRNPFETPTK